MNHTRCLIWWEACGITPCCDITISSGGAQGTCCPFRRSWQTAPLRQHLHQWGLQAKSTPSQLSALRLCYLLLPLIGVWTWVWGRHAARSRQQLLATACGGKHCRQWGGYHTTPAWCGACASTADSGCLTATPGVGWWAACACPGPAGWLVPLAKQWRDFQGRAGQWLEAGQWAFKAGQWLDTPTPVATHGR